MSTTTIGPDTHNVDVDARDEAATGGKPAGRRTPPPLSRDVIPGAGLGAQWTPHGALGALVLAAAATRAAMDATDADAQIALWTAGTAFVIAVVAAVVAGRRLSDRKSRHRAYAFAAVAATWLSTVTVTGLSLNAVAVLAVLGYGLSLHWWRKHRIPNPQKATTSGAADVYMTRWKRYVACAGGALPESRLTSPEPIGSGVRYVLRLVPGKQTYGGALGVLEQIRGGLGLLREQDLIVEPHPVLAEPALALTVVTRSPVREAVEWPGPSALDPTTGRVRLGPFSDGEGVAAWKAYANNRLWGGYLQGGTGSGKSRMIESIALSLAASDSHPTVVWFGDGQGGASSPLLIKAADHAARTHEQIHAMLAGALLVMQLRQDENALDDHEGFTPTTDRPGLLIVIDECHKPLSPIENPKLAEHTQYLAATIAREGGKVGVALILASQQSTLDAFGGAGKNAEALRSNLLNGNGVILRSKDNNAKTVFGVDVDPRKFPPLPGYAFLVDPEEGARSAPFRGYYVTDTQRAYWPGRITWRSLDTGAANAYGHDYLHRHELAAQAREEIRRRIAARRAGQPVPAEPTPAGQRIEVTIPAPTTTATAGFPVAEFPVWAHPTAPAPQPAPPPAPAGRPLHDGHHAVLDAIASGHHSPAAITAATGYSERQVHNLLGELTNDHGLVHKAGHGRYELTGRAA